MIRLIVGNEVVLRGDLTVPETHPHTRPGPCRPSTGEHGRTSWHVWLRHPELADHVDYLAVHMLPYWKV
ncbi:MAG: hypothetical protein R3F24_14830 [Gammaproteobacteria bacterium]